MTEPRGTGRSPAVGRTRARFPDSATRVRPYVRTGGRTKSGTDLALETMVTFSGRGRPANLDYRTVVELCGVPRSIAEVAALSSMPVGVARVLVGDLAEQGVLTVHHTREETESSGVDLMERVLAGLRRL